MLKSINESVTFTADQMKKSRKATKKYFHNLVKWGHLKIVKTHGQEGKVTFSYVSI